MKKTVKKFPIIFTALFTAVLFSARAYAESYLTSNGFSFWMLNSEEAAIHGYDSRETDVVIPHMIGGAFVTEIDEYAFFKSTSTTSVSFPAKSRITSIGESAFYGCSSITSIELPPQLEILSESVFQGCSSLEKVKINEGLHIVSNQAFYNCGKLYCVNIPDSVEKIGALAFANCKALAEITIPDSVKSISSNAFKNDEITIYCNSGSYAQQYAQSQNISYVLLDKLMPGDVNLNGKVNIDDATAVQRYLASMLQLSSEARLNADSDRDGQIKIDDVTTIQKYIAGIITEL